MKFSSLQLALAASIYFGRQGREYPLDQLAEITDAVYELVALKEPVDLELALQFIGFAFQGDKLGILSTDAKEDLKLLVGKALYWAGQE